MLVAQLRRSDRVAIVVYAGSAGLVLDSTPGRDKRTILQAIERLQSGGSTAGGEGIRLAYEIARKNFIEGGNNRVVLATDGDFNVGVTSDGELVTLIERERESGVFLTVLGVGDGNLQDAKMEKLADHGNGNYAYLDDLAEAQKVLVSEMGGTIVTIAKDVKIQVEFNPARVKEYRLIGYENRVLKKEDFADDRKDAGELGAGHSVTALYEVIPARGKAPRGEDLTFTRVEVKPESGERPELLIVNLRYKAPDGDESRLLQRAAVDGGTRFADSSEDFRFAAAVAELAMLLRDSAHAGSANFDHVIRTAGGATGADRDGYRAEFVDLAEVCKAIRPQLAIDD
jgi:Ca-activated chloride channel family protein